MAAAQPGGLRLVGSFMASFNSEYRKAGFNTWSQGFDMTVSCFVDPHELVDLSDVVQCLDS